MTPDTLWDRWRDLTRFLESTRISFKKERQYWAGVPYEERPEGPLRSEDLGGLSAYEISVTDHLKTVWDESVLCQSVLIFSFALAEAAALGRLGLDPDKDHGGIEAWGYKILQSAGKDWSDVDAGKAAVVEAAVARNQAAHAASNLRQKAVNRLTAAGCVRYQVGDQMSFDYAVVDDHRAALRSLLRTAGFNRATRD